MTGEEFKNIINYYKEENILSISFDNSAAKTFREGEFTLENNWVDDISCLQFVDFDNKCRPFHVIKHVENIQGIIVRDSNVPFASYDDYVTLRG